MQNNTISKAHALEAKFLNRPSSRAQTIRVKHKIKKRKQKNKNKNKNTHINY